MRRTSVWVVAMATVLGLGLISTTSAVAAPRGYASSDTRAAHRAPHAAPRATGVKVTITKAASSVPASVVVTGPHYRRTLHATTRLTGLHPGIYTIASAPTVLGRATRGLPATTRVTADVPRRAVRVIAGSVAAATVRYMTVTSPQERTVPASAVSQLRLHAGTYTAVFIRKPPALGAIVVMAPTQARPRGAVFRVTRVAGRTASGPPEPFATAFPSYFLPLTPPTPQNAGTFTGHDGPGFSDNGSLNIDLAALLAAAGDDPEGNPGPSTKESPFEFSCHGIVIPVTTGLGNVGFYPVHYTDFSDSGIEHSDLDGDLQLSIKGTVILGGSIVLKASIPLTCEGSLTLIKDIPVGDLFGVPLFAMVTIPVEAADTDDLTVTLSKGIKGTIDIEAGTQNNGITSHFGSIGSGITVDQDHCDVEGKQGIGVQVTVTPAIGGNSGLFEFLGLNLSVYLKAGVEAEEKPREAPSQTISAYAEIGAKVSVPGETYTPAALKRTFDPIVIDPSAYPGCADASPSPTPSSPRATPPASAPTPTSAPVPPTTQPAPPSSPSPTASQTGGPKPPSASTPDATLSSSASLANGTAQQDGSYTFSGTAGTTYDLGFNHTMSTAAGNCNCNLAMFVEAPDGSKTEGSLVCFQGGDTNACDVTDTGNGFAFTYNAKTTGTYTLTYNLSEQYAGTPLTVSSNFYLSTPITFQDSNQPGASHNNVAVRPGQQVVDTLNLEHAQDQGPESTLSSTAEEIMTGRSGGILTVTSGSCGTPQNADDTSTVHCAVNNGTSVVTWQAADANGAPSAEDADADFLLVNNPVPS